MRISDWSSDVCSSDLIAFLIYLAYRALYRKRQVGSDNWEKESGQIVLCRVLWGDNVYRSEERREGKECVVRVDLGGRRIIKNKEVTKTQNQQLSKESRRSVHTSDAK